MIRSSIAAAIASVFIVVAAPSAVLAQGPGPEAGGAHHMHPSHEFKLPSVRVEERLASVRTRLEITEAQQPQWDAYAEVLRNHARIADARMQAMKSQMEQRKPDDPKPTVIERLDRQQQMMADASQRLQQVTAAVKPLYDVLSDAQRALADRLLAPPPFGMPQRARMHGGPAART